MFMCIEVSSILGVTFILTKKTCFCFVHVLGAFPVLLCSLLSLSLFSLPPLFVLFSILPRLFRLSCFSCLLSLLASRSSSLCAPQVSCLLVVSSSSLSRALSLHALFLSLSLSVCVFVTTMCLLHPTKMNRHAELLKRHLVTTSQPNPTFENEQNKPFRIQRETQLD